MKKYDPEHDPVLSRGEVRAIDKWAIEKMGIPGAILMENAGRSCAEFILSSSDIGPVSSVVIFCGTGNNGGDGFVVARHLANAGVPVRIVICGNAFKISGDAKTNLDIIRRMNIPVEQIDVDWRHISQRVSELCGGASVIVDGLFGTGLTGHLDEHYINLVEAINKQNIPIISIDIPSGLDCDSGHPLGAAVKAVATITFVAAKHGFKHPSAAEYTGEVYIASIGIEPNHSGH